MFARQVNVQTEQRIITEKYQSGNPDSGGKKTPFFPILPS